MKDQIKIALAFVGLLVGAGTASGQELIQYFISFGVSGIWGVLLSSVIMCVAGAVIFQIGSYFLAKEHGGVFTKILHPIVSRAFDWSVTLTLFAMGFVMLAGAGSNLEQQFNVPTWVGSTIMLVLVIATGLLDVEKVSAIIGGITPFLVLAVVGAFVYTLFNFPSDFTHLNEIAVSLDSPVRPWWLSALNYCGMALLLGVSMCLVIGGSHVNLRTAGRGGFFGGLLFSVLILMSSITLLANIADVHEDSVPTQSLYTSIHPTLGLLMTFIIFAMIFNTAIGMFYALGKRVSSRRPEWYVPSLIGVSLLGYAVSFIGFEGLMSVFYPLIGWAGLAMIILLVGWWVKSRVRIARERDRRDRITDIVSERGQGEGETDGGDPALDSELNAAIDECDADNDRLNELIHHGEDASVEESPATTEERPATR
ncbi:YkvI family membrane protein [Corynebacterium sp. AOP40-9SA-29]|uniref:YkvI family membrane protein n=1 Tax=Corynebacterium sp. AOP40-9SA-29 TaxID=3457677 RepID=UPI004033636F